MLGTLTLQLKLKEKKKPTKKQKDKPKFVKYAKLLISVYSAKTSGI
jgi:hypothetical protein